MKKRLVCLLLSVAVVFSFSPLFTIQADAFSTGAKTYIKTKTVTVKPGKTYKVPVVKLKAKKIIQVPVKITISPKSAKKEVTKGGYKLILKNSKGKLETTYKHSLKDLGDEYWSTYTGWIYFYKKSVSNPCFSKGKYYITFKNTSNCTLKVKYSVKGYSKYASNADFKKSVTVNYASEKSKFKYFEGSQFPYTYIGRIGPGLPEVTSVKSSNKSVTIEDTWIAHDGKVYVYVETGEESADTVISVKLKNKKKPYKINCKVIEY